MRSNGFTLIDLITTLSIVSILLALGLPSFSALIQNTRVKTATLNLLGSINLTRTQAVFSNNRATITKHNQWADGWEVFVDNDNNGVRGGDEKLVQQRDKLEGIRIVANKWIKNNVSYIGTGESRSANGTTAGGFQAGTFSICPTAKGKGFELILARGGRVRMAEIDEEKCNSI